MHRSKILSIYNNSRFVISPVAELKSALDPMELLAWLLLESQSCANIAIRTDSIYGHRAPFFWIASALRRGRAIVNFLESIVNSRIPTVGLYHDALWAID